MDAAYAPTKAMKDSLDIPVSEQIEASLFYRILDAMHVNDDVAALDREVFGATKRRLRSSKRTSELRP